MDKGESRSADQVMTQDELLRLAFGTLIEINFIAMRSLILMSGSERAIALNRPYWSHSGSAAALILRKHLGIGGDSSKEMDRMYDFVTFVCRMEGVTVNQREVPWSGIIITSCPFKHGPPEYCVLIEEVIGTAMAGVHLPQGEIVVRSAMTKGEPFCRLELFDHDTKQIQSMNERKLGAEHPPMSDEERSSWAVQYVGEQWVMITRAILDSKRPGETIDVASANLRLLGQVHGLRMAEKACIGAKDARGAASLVSLCNLMFQQAGREVEAEKGAYVKEITSCPFQHAPAALCAQHEAFLKGICEAVDPRLSFSYERMMTRGEGSCRWAITRRSD